MLADRITVSVVSHGQGELVNALLLDLARHCHEQVEVILTLNLPENPRFDIEKFGYPVRLIQNPVPKGFGANHNAAFRLAQTQHFCILNPDIRLYDNPFPALLNALCDPENGVVAPLIRNPSGGTEDSARKFPTPLSILRKVVANTRAPDYAIRQHPLRVDWVAGMFLVLKADTFRTVSGFDEGYFLYYEDVDLCWRLRLQGQGALLVPAATAVHDARRQSHRNLRYLMWHVASMWRFFEKRAREIFRL